MSCGATHLIRWVAPVLALALVGCGGTLKCDLSEAPGIAVASLGPPAPGSATTSPSSVQLAVVYSSRLAPSIGTAFDRTSLGGTAIPIAQLDDPYKPLIPTPPVELLVGKAIEGFLARRNTATVVCERASLSSGLLVDVSRFEMDGSPNDRDLFFEARVTVLSGGAPTYDRTITLKRSARLGTGAAEAVGSAAGLAGAKAGAAVDVATEQRALNRLCGELLGDCIREMSADPRLMALIDEATNAE